jgi:aminocarboxymuconate-semialdehyde decarboxylase
MNAVDSHAHWFPPAYYEFLSKRTTEPRTEPDGDWWKFINGNRSVRMWPEWFDLEQQFETAAGTGTDMALVSSAGIHSDMDGLDADAAREGARIINEEWSAAQRRYPGRFYGIAAVPLQDTAFAIEELDHAISTLDLRGVSIPGSIAGEGLDAPRLAPFWARVEELGVPMFIHPTDGVFVDVMEGYENKLYKALGRVVDSSAGVLRLILSGTLDRHPDLKILHFHAGGVLPYAAGRLNKNAGLTTLEHPPSEYLKRMWVDTAMPAPLTLKTAIEFYGLERVMYGSDNPCWTPMAAFETAQALELPEGEFAQLMDTNVRKLVDLRVPAGVTGSEA